MRTLRFLGIVSLGLLFPLPGSSAGESAPGRPRLALKQPPQIEPAPQRSERFTLKARFAREESSGQLREGGAFALIGRLAKGGVSCPSGDGIFDDGFEGS